MKGSGFVVFGAFALVLMFANRAFAEGAYQRTDDRKKTIVWNNDPQPGDAAEWTGKRDPEGYADGSGTLNWFRTQKAFATGSNIASSNKKVPISQFKGTMVHGKFEGAVTTIDHGKTYYGNFVDGQRKGNWSTSPIVANATSAEPPAASEKPKKTATVTEPKIAAAKKVETPAEPKTSKEAEPEPPTEGPDETTAEAKGQTSEASGSTTGTSANPSTLNSQPSTPLIAQASEADESATPRQQPITKKAALAPGAVRAIEQPGRQVEKKSEKAKETAQKVKKTPKPEEPKAAPTIVERESESPAEGPNSAIAETAQPPNPKSTTEVPSQPSSLDIQPSAEESPVDDSIRTLTGPPSSLRTKTAPTTTTPATEIAPPATSTSSTLSAAATPKLNAVQAMDIADIEARTRGYDLGEYQLPKAEYNAANDTWSVSYVGRDKAKKHLSVVVQDKSGKAEVNK